MSSPSSPTPTLGLLAPLVAKPEKTSDVAQFLLSGYDIVTKDEPLTLQWFAVKYANSHTYAIFDTFADEGGRSAHIGGGVAKALGAKSEELLSSLPDIGPIKVLASKVQAVKGAEGMKAGLVNGLRVLISAKPDKVDAVRQFLIGALPLVEGEPDTPVWYAIEYPGTSVFGIVDFFPSEDGRKAHLSGKVAEALFASADELLSGTPDIVMVDVLAAKL